MHAKSTGELISFGFSGRSVRSSVSDKRSANRSVQKKKKRLQFSADLWSQSEFRTQNIMSVLGYGRDEMLAVFLAKTYCLPILLYACEIWRMSSFDKHKLDVAWNICFRKIFNACWRESAKPLLFYCGTMPVSLLVDQRKMIFYLRSTNIVLRVVCRLLCMRPTDCFQSIMFLQGILAT